MTTRVDARVERALVDAEPTPYWTSRPGAPAPGEPLLDETSADLAVVGGGLTGLWTALEAKRRTPDLDVVLLESARIGHGASGRNGGFLSSSLTHGLAHGVATWPDEIEQLVRLGRENVAAIDRLARAEGWPVDLRLSGKTVVATRPHQVAGLRDLASLHRRYGEDATFLGASEVQADLASPTYLAGMRVRTGGGLVDPAQLCWSLLAAIRARGVRVYERSGVGDLGAGPGGRVRLTTGLGRVDADRVVVATNAYPAPLRRLRHWILPVHDHVLVTEPLGDADLAALGWPERQGFTDAGNQFHYYRLTADDRVLWGGYDAIYEFAGRVDGSPERRAASHRVLADHFFATFPQLAHVRFSHRWSGIIDSTTRFTPMFGTAHGGRVAYAVGYTGLGVAASRFGAEVALDLLSGLDTERTSLALVRRRPLPFPPEPVRYAGVQATRRALIRQDERAGRRGPWLRLLDRIGVGFAS